ncbi:MAG: hypothetical protein CMP10_06835 [Zetaproteobacteria bacterium]|nr:hypothetical protein [Pseudobdellovibrionaceae bacterium]
MKLKLWGTRGSLPRTLNNQIFSELLIELSHNAEAKGINTLAEFRKAITSGKLGVPLTFGGNTTCTEIIHKKTRCFVDMGSGFLEAGEEALKDDIHEFNVFMTHLHSDHLLGFPYFVPIHIPGNKFTIHHVHPLAPKYIMEMFNGVYFPVKWNELQADIEFKQLKIYEPTQLSDLKVTPFCLDHPGGSFGYHFESEGKKACVGVDGEYKRLTPKELGKDLIYYQNLDILIFDAQYELNELASRSDWGHCSPNIGVDLALREGIRNIYLTHHDPKSAEAKGFRMLEAARKHKKLQLPAHADLWDKLNQPDGPNINMAWDGLEIDVDKL